MDEEKKTVRGIVTRGVGGLYGVRAAEDPDTEILCRARGILRQKKTAPTVGDDVLIELSEGKALSDLTAEPALPPEKRPGPRRRDPRGQRPGRRSGGSAMSGVDEDRGGDVDWVIDAVEERRSLMIRPPVSNLDYLFAVIPGASPEPDLLTADKLTVIAENYGIECVIVVNKADIDPARAAEIREIYETAGMRVFPLSAASGEGVDALRDYLC